MPISPNYMTYEMIPRKSQDGSLKWIALEVYCHPVVTTDAKTFQMTNGQEASSPFSKNKLLIFGDAVSTFILEYRDRIRLAIEGFKIK